MAWPSLRTERTSTAISSGATPERTSRSISAAAPWAWARSLAQRQKRTLPPGGASATFSMRPSIGATTACAAVSTAAGARSERSRRTLRAPGRAVGQVAQVPGRRAAPAAHRAVVVARGGQPAVLAAERHDEAQAGELEVLGVVDEHVAPARADARAHVGLVVQEGDGAQQEVAEVERALLAQHPVVGLVDVRRTRARARRADRPRAGRRPSARPRRR